MSLKATDLSPYESSLCSNICALAQAIELFHWTVRTAKIDARSRFGDVLKATFDLEGAAKSVPKHERWKTAELVSICEEVREDLRSRTKLDCILLRVRFWAGSFGEMEGDYAAAHYHGR